MSSDEGEGGTGGENTAAAKQRSQNEACTNCRMVKRRCLHDGANETCIRCAKQGLECVYQQQKRGRKPGTLGPRKRAAAEAAAAAAGTSNSSGGSNGEPSRLTSPTATTSTTAPPPLHPPYMPMIGGYSETHSRPTPPQRDWLSDELMDQRANQQQQPSHDPRMYNVPPVSYPPRNNPPPSYGPPPSHPHPHPSGLPDPRGYASLQQNYPPPPPPPSERPVDPRAYEHPAEARPYDHRLHAAPHPPPNQPSSNHPPSTQAQGQHTTSTTSPTIPTPTNATGGFSLKKLLAEQARSDQEPQRQSLADAFAVDTASNGLRKEPERRFQDIVSAGVLPLETLEGLYTFYFTHLNPMTSLLDPALHTLEFCRTKSPFLITAIATVSAKVTYLASYPACSRYAKTLLAQAFEHGINNVELVQAICTLVFWQDAVDDSGARKLAYAIRSAFELNLFKPKKRPLPENEFERRLALNGERTWLYLTIADHRFSTQRGLPKIIDSRYRVDAVPWIQEHGEDFCPDEAGLAPLLRLGRLLDVFDVLTSPDDGQLPSLELLRCLERDVTDWARDWSSDKPSIRLQPSQSSLVRFYARVFQFQLDEVNLFIATKQRQDAANRVVFDREMNPAVVFGSCVKGAIAVLDTMTRDLTYMVYSFDSMWVGAASAAIWICRNIVGMHQQDRTTAIDAISRLKTACSTNSATTPQCLAAHTARLLDHLLLKIETAHQAETAPAMHNPYTAPALHQATSFKADWTNPIYGEGIGGILGGRKHANGVQNYWAFETPDNQQQGQQENNMDYNGQSHSNHQNSSNGGGGAAPYSSFLSPMPPSTSMIENLYPAADDAMWSALMYADGGNQHV